MSSFLTGNSGAADARLQIPDTKVVTAAKAPSSAGRALTATPVVRTVAAESGLIAARAGKVGIDLRVFIETPDRKAHGHRSTTQPCKLCATAGQSRKLRGWAQIGGPRGVVGTED